MYRHLHKTMVIGLVFCCAVAWADRAQGETRPSPTGIPTSAPSKARILFLHHSTGECVWNGGVAAWFDAYNKAGHTEYRITEQNFPKSEPYGWKNYPYDYWNIWVRHAGDKPYQTEPTLEMLTRQYDVIVFKHCFPVSAIEPDTGQADVAGEDKRIENYKLQYAALKKKLHEFAKTKFIVWTGAALVKGETDEAAARRAKAFFDWVRSEWDQPGDNIYIWDFHTLETEGGLYLKADYASGDSHPNERFSKMVAPLLGRRIVDVICGAGDSGSITGQGDRRPAAGKPKAPTAAQTEPKPVKPKPTTPPPTPKAGPDTWVFDDAEDPQRQARLWDKAAAYAEDAQGHVIKMRFAEADEQDWGEYGLQRIITTKRLEPNHDIAPYRYLALRARSDRDMELVVTLITRPDSLPRDEESYFGFTAYPRTKAGEWQWIVLDLAKLELGAEGEKAYTAAGEPTRPEHLTSIKFVTAKANEAADLAVDDIAFYRVLPKSLAGKVQAP